MEKTSVKKWRYFKTDVKKAKEHWEKAKKELGKDAITVELLNYDGDGAKK